MGNARHILPGDDTRVVAANGHCITPGLILNALVDLVVV
jgi:hypothetical protein